MARFGGAQTQGARPYQEDDSGIWTLDSSGATVLAVLADGMGGHQGGKHASGEAVETFMDAYAGLTSASDEPDRLWRAAQHANRQLALDAEYDAELEGMGTTLIGVVVRQGKMFWVSIGDSPLWLYRAGTLRQLNADHSLKSVLEEQVRQGELSAEEAAQHPKRNALRSALMGQPLDLVDLPRQPVELQEGDRILLASDGMESLGSEEIVRIIESNPDSEACAKRLVQQVDQHGLAHQDNATVVVLAPAVASGAQQGKSKERKSGKRSKALVCLLLLIMAGIVVALGWGWFSGPGWLGFFETREQGAALQEGSGETPSKDQDGDKLKTSEDTSGDQPESQSPDDRDQKDKSEGETKGSGNSSSATPDIAPEDPGDGGSGEKKPQESPTSSKGSQGGQGGAESDQEDSE